MSKQKTQRQLAENQAQSYTNSLRISPQKLNLVASSIRGLNVSNAVNQLQFSRKKAGKLVLGALNSAIANAENNHGLDIDQLFVSEATVGKSIVMKRFRARARGRGARILKPFSNLTVVVEERKE